MPQAGSQSVSAAVGLHAVHDRLDELAGREILARSLRAFGGALGEQPLVDVALHVRLHRHPLLGLDQVHDQATERDRVLDLRLRLLEDLAEHPRLRAEVFEDVAIMGLQGVAFLAQQARPVDSQPGRSACGCRAAWSARPPS